MNVLLQNPSTQSQKRSRAKTHKERNVVTSTSRRSNFLAIACSQSLCPGAVHSGHSVVAMDSALAPHPRARPHVALPAPPAGLRARPPRLPPGQHSLTALQGRPAPPSGALGPGENGVRAGPTRRGACTPAAPAAPSAAAHPSPTAPAPAPGCRPTGCPSRGSGPEVCLGSLRLVLGPRGRRPPGLGVHRSAPWARSAGPPGSLWTGVPGSLRRRLPRPRPECQLSEGRPRHGGGCSCPRASTLRPLPATCKESQMTARRPLPQAESQHVTRRLRRSDRDASAACAGPTSGGRRPGACR